MTWERHVKTSTALVLAWLAVGTGVGCTLDADSLTAADLDTRLTALEQRVSEQALTITKLRITAGSAAALAMCHGTEPNASTDPQYVVAGTTGDATCAAFRAGGTCRETHLVYAYDGGSAEGSSAGQPGCAVTAEYSNPALIGFWACCNR